MGASQRNLCGAVEGEHWSLQGDFQTWSPFRIAQQSIAKPERITVERTRRWYADFPIADATGVVLDGGQGAATEHIHGGRLVIEFVEGSSKQSALGKARVVQYLAHVFQVGLDAIELAVVECLHQPLAGRFAIGLMHNHLGEHGIIERRHLRTRLDPGVDSQAILFGPGHVGEQACAGLEILVGVFRIDPGLDGVAGRREVAAQFCQVGQGACAQFHHPSDQIHAINLLGHTVLHL